MYIQLDNDNRVIGTCELETQECNIIIEDEVFNQLQDPFRMKYENGAFSELPKTAEELKAEINQNYENKVA